MQEFFDSTWIQDQVYFYKLFQDICIHAYLLAPENFLFPYYEWDWLGI